MLIYQLKISRMIPQTSYRLNVNLDKISSFSLLPPTNAGEIESFDCIVNPNLHLYRLHAISENIKSIFMREEERQTRPRDTRRHVRRFIATL